MLNDKVKQIIVNSGFSPSHFADEIGVQRSSISHILANRNKPSFDILQKIIKRFPQLGYDWLDNEGVNPPKSDNLINEITAAKRGPKPITQKSEPSQNSYGSPQNLAQNTHLSESSKKNLFDSLSVQPNVMTQVFDTTIEKSVERIIVFYSDNSFKEFKPQ